MNTNRVNQITAAVRSMSLDAGKTTYSEDAKALGKQVSVESGISSFGGSSESLTGAMDQKQIMDRVTSISSEHVGKSIISRDQSLISSGYGSDFETSDMDYEGFEVSFDDGNGNTDSTGTASQSSSGVIIKSWGEMPDKTYARSLLIDDGDFDYDQSAGTNISGIDDEQDIEFGMLEPEQKSTISDDDSDFGGSDIGYEQEEGVYEQEEEANERQVFMLLDSQTGKTWVERTRVIEESKSNLLAEEVKEFELLSKLNHPNIVKMLGAEIERFDDGLEVTLATEYAGVAFGEVVRALPEGEQIQALTGYAIGMLNGLAYLHSQAIMHRDIKPDNMLVDPEANKLTIIDLGLAWDCSKQFPIDQAGSSMFAAPEVRRGEEQDYKADIYAAGRSILEVMLDIQAVDLGWLRQEKGDNTIPQLHDSRRSDTQSLRLLHAITQMTMPDPEKRPSAKQARDLLVV
ncbi:hypothetical protein EOPP23_07210 [Endozoicomonas sp. OPT23]|uniref:protein kinase family protein n=1 Tax=Endozoicomonas sp. OPT23 TaxID=2072845 RepID=UPI00129B9367|nr:protein kinase family protein [Endozoicomonas sp. OPT23]MRI32770.1 hypothetical protein [Endozoicomonas sp. OPT23]